LGTSTGGGKLSRTATKVGTKKTGISGFLEDHSPLGLKKRHCLKHRERKRIDERTVFRLRDEGRDQGKRRERIKLLFSREYLGLINN